jgi:hypothetical protein
MYILLREGRAALELRVSRRITVTGVQRCACAKSAPCRVWETVLQRIGAVQVADFVPGAHHRSPHTHTECLAAASNVLKLILGLYAGDSSLGQETTNFSKTFFRG